MIDLIMTLTTCAMGYAMIPQVIKSARDREVAIAWQTLIVTTAGISTFAVCFWVMGLRINVIANGLLVILWASLIVMKIVFKKLDKPA